MMDTAQLFAHNAAAIELMVHGAAGLPEEEMIDDLTDLPNEIDPFSQGSLGIPDGEVSPAMSPL